MANLDKFINCKPRQYKAGELLKIDEIISLEQKFSFDYSCKYNEKIYTGSKELYAYPDEISGLIIGHTVLDLLPCYEANFDYELSQDGSHYKLNLIANDAKQKSIVHSNLELENILQVMSGILEAKGKWDGTGCFHRAALFHPKSKEIIMAEDIGRHNCVDRLKGHCIINNLPIEDYFLFITARITASIYHKIRRAGINTIISRSAITSEAYEHANKTRCTLAAFCRPEGQRVTLFAGEL